MPENYFVTLCNKRKSEFSRFYHNVTSALKHQPLKQLPVIRQQWANFCLNEIFSLQTQWPMVNHRQNRRLKWFALAFHYVKNLIAKSCVFTEHLKQATFHTRKWFSQTLKKTVMKSLTLYKEVVVCKYSAK